MNYKSRFQKLKKAVKLGKADAFLLSSTSTTRYFSGFLNEDAWILITQEAAFYITDDRYTEEAERQLKLPALKLTNIKKGFAAILKEGIKKRGGFRILVEENDLSLVMAQRIKSIRKGTKLLSGSLAIAQIRMIKEEAEIKLVRKATKIADKAYKEMMALKLQNFTEKALQTWLIRRMEDLGAEGESFAPIIGYGQGSSMPHYSPSAKRKIGKSNLLVVDWGSIYRGYCSDCTRTVLLGKVAPELEKIWEVCNEAQLAQLAALKPGVDLFNIDKIGRDIITKSGYGPQFCHGTGHGVGLDVHEFPGVNPKLKIKAKAGMLITIEPGIYLPGKGGVRIEDLMLITKMGAERLTKLPKKKRL
jgi:Xaa-Pro aminopeptidase